MTWTREDAERILMACREADPALFGSATIAQKDDGTFVLQSWASDDDAQRVTDIAARATKLANATCDQRGVHSRRGDRTVGRRYFDADEQSEPSR